MLKMCTLIHFARAVDSTLGARQLARTLETLFSDTGSFQSIVFHGFNFWRKFDFSRFLELFWRSGVRAGQYIKSIAQNYEVKVPQSSVGMRIMYVLKNLYGNNFCEHAKIEVRNNDFFNFSKSTYFLPFFW